METEIAMLVVRPATSRISGALHYRRTLFIVAALTMAAAGALNWSWLVAVGAAPLILSVLPCVAMCGLGICIGGSCKRGVDVGQEAKPLSTESISSARSGGS